MIEVIGLGVGILLLYIITIMLGMVAVSYAIDFWKFLRRGK